MKILLQASLVFMSLGQILLQAGYSDLQAGGVFNGPFLLSLDPLQDGAQFFAPEAGGIYLRVALGDYCLGGLNPGLQAAV